jgi:hypothetical protein
MTGTATISPNIADGAMASYDVTVTNMRSTAMAVAWLRDYVLPDGLFITVGYKADDTARVTILNMTGGVWAPVDPVTLAVRAQAS